MALLWNRHMKAVFICIDIQSQSEIKKYVYPVPKVFPANLFCYFCLFPSWGTIFVLVFNSVTTSVIWSKRKGYQSLSWKYFIALSIVSRNVGGNEDGNPKSTILYLTLVIFRKGWVIIHFANMFSASEVEGSARTPSICSILLSKLILVSVRNLFKIVLDVMFNKLHWLLQICI